MNKSVVGFLAQASRQWAELRSDANGSEALVARHNCMMLGVAAALELCDSKNVRTCQVSWFLVIFSSIAVGRMRFNANKDQTRKQTNQHALYIFAAQQGGSQINICANEDQTRNPAYALSIRGTVRRLAD